MAGKRTTIKDIAGQAGVSLGTVHCALAGKPGVGDATRQRILSLARTLNYRPNAMAASLKRKTVTVAAAFPEPTGDNRYYFPFVWQGVRDYLHTQGDLKINLIELPHHKGTDLENELAGLLERDGLDGLLTSGFMDDFGQPPLSRFTGLDIPVALVGDDMPQSGRLCCVQPDYEVIGRTLAELLSRQIPRDGSILVCAGNASMPSHYLIVAGIDAYMRENGMKNPVYTIHNSRSDGEKITRELERHADIAACVAVNARGSVMLGRALVDTGRAGKVIAVGNDLFEENVAFLRDGVFTNLLHKNQYHQARTAARLLVDHLLRGRSPDSEVTFVSSEVVFRSALPMYARGHLSAPVFRSGTSGMNSQ